MCKLAWKSYQLLASSANTEIQLPAEWWVWRGGGNKSILVSLLAIGILLDWLG